MLFSWLLASLILLLLPVWIGRQAFTLWFSNNTRVYELYTSATGVYALYLMIRATTLLTGWIRQGWAQVSNKIREWTVVVS